MKAKALVNSSRDILENSYAISITLGDISATNQAQYVNE